MPLELTEQQKQMFQGGPRPSSQPPEENIPPTGQQPVEDELTQDPEYFDDLEDGFEDDPPEETGDGSWINQEIENEAAIYGLSRQQLEQMSGEDEFDRFATIADQTQFNNSMQFNQYPNPIGQQNFQQQQEPLQNQQPSESSIDAELETINKVLEKPDDFTEETIALARISKNFYEQRVADEERIRQENENQMLVSFNQAVDGLGNEAFGKVFMDNGQLANLSPQEQAQRSVLYNTTIAMAQHLSNSNQPIPPIPALVRRAARMTRGPAQSNQDQNRLQKQSRRRRGSNSRSRNRQVAQSTEGMSEAAKIASHPSIQKFFQK